MPGAWKTTGNKASEVRARTLGEESSSTVPLANAATAHSAGAQSEPSCHRACTAGTTAARFNVSRRARKKMALTDLAAASMVRTGFTQNGRHLNAKPLQREALCRLFRGSGAKTGCLGGQEKRLKQEREASPLPRAKFRTGLKRLLARRCHTGLSPRISDPSDLLVPPQAGNRPAELEKRDPPLSRWPSSRDGREGILGA